MWQKIVPEILYIRYFLFKEYLKMKYFCMPADFSNETINSYSEINRTNSTSKVVETYGQITSNPDFGSCRPNGNLPPIDLEKLKSYVEYSNEKGIEFNYVFNPTHMENIELTKTGFTKIKTFLKSLQAIGVNSITIALPTIMEICKEVCPNLKIKASTICQINSPTKAKHYADIGIERIVLDEDIYRNFDILKNIRKMYTGELEVIVNSFCLNDCPFKMFHYNAISYSHKNSAQYPFFSTNCHQLHMNAENFMKLNWIRPEDIHYYNDLGINYFKIQGRTNVTTGDPVKAVKYYMDEKYDGDLVRLLELFSYKRPLSVAQAEIDNRMLDGFFDKFYNDPKFCTKVCDNCGYCKSYAEKSMSKTDIYLIDIAKEINTHTIDTISEVLGKDNL